MLLSNGSDEEPGVAVAGEPSLTSLRRRAAWTRGALFVVITALVAANTVSAVSHWVLRTHMATLEETLDRVTSLPMYFWESRAFMAAFSLSVIAAIGAIVSGIGFLLWTYRATANAQIAEPRIVEVSPAWAVGSHFVPIVSLVAPLQALRQVWRASVTSRRSSTAPLWIWWASWNVIVCYAAFAVWRAPSSGAGFVVFAPLGEPSSWNPAALFGAVWSVAILACPIALLTIIARVTEGQQRWRGAHVFQ